MHSRVINNYMTIKATRTLSDFTAGHPRGRGQRRSVKLIRLSNHNKKIIIKIIIIITRTKIIIIIIIIIIYYVIFMIKNSNNNIT